MKNIVISALISLFTITATVAAEEYKTFTIPFKQSKNAEKVIVEIPSFPMSYDDDTKFPEPGTYILNKPEVLKRELERTGDYRVHTILEIYLIIGLIGILAGIIIVMFVITARTILKATPHNS